MLFIYNLIVHFASFLLKIVAFFSPKIKLFVSGRRTVFATLRSKINLEDKTIWFHAASLGEYEQGLPVIEKIKEHFPAHKIVVTFFSPSGYEIRKTNKVADVTVYLPLDTKSNAQDFLKLVHPEMVFFIKYEYWPNYLHELKKQNIKTYLISGVFREKQSFFKWYGGFYRNALQSFDYFFVQNESSKKLLQSIGFNNVKISGDTRFDRVASVLERDNSLGFIEQFKNNTTTIVIGSSWPKDENLLVNYINKSSNEVKFIIAPHNIKSEQIQELKKAITKKAVLFTEKENQDLSSFNVFIIDTIGILTKIYSYADIAYVGGGFGNPGVHNLLEPATFGVPIVIGTNFSHFAEATALVNMTGCVSISNQKELNEILDNLIQNPDERFEKGHICSTFVNMNKGATNVVLKHIC
ncbi:3-deoxy-D-manno-octulosonic acid transferase [Flavobacterium psychrophilum]|uniref:3-deoxy-D-manno-octulosonic acid transferase n=8 Tax=Flavobacterium psychrophilum TaxID=96345 RepID=A6GWP2_FLAPJ|nr:glycosyltransferase N-terminal domain-containing protein [Flavobacterium psychrophilum]AIG29320.1 3-deoxy-D-manno-octulosonic acid transferase [Flavobacterium psychrophilum]AIG31597.1 3-deoxy-D-manno-octulosonic acid transferase [Flavobacterium psychrophilum]AIG33751.1 3-deoxy-D-manno-octulosonic acid transferase [Flavobacterium psychrophilum]AIG36113.1 3-deoxy-D-manno-octulosonic acid transferase [Flavobacterium psychrophilum]AIG38379.1 3-deoxy-D-manno-octulosonic acid transferase [Flavoba